MVNFKLKIDNIIQELANNFNLSIPIVTDKEINRIIWKYPISEDELLSIKDEKIWEKHSFKYALFKRINKKPKELNIRYIFKALKIDYPDEEDRTEYNGISIN